MQNLTVQSNFVNTVGYYDSIRLPQILLNISMFPFAINYDADRRELSHPCPQKTEMRLPPQTDRPYYRNNDLLKHFRLSPERIVRYVWLEEFDEPKKGAPRMMSLIFEYVFKRLNSTFARGVIKLK